MDEKTKQRILKLAAGNPGAIKVLEAIWRNLVGDDWSSSMFDVIEKASLKGSEIWVLWKDVCHEKFENLISMLTYRTPTDILRLVMEKM
jgi:hypothetical protein